jgi:hypothetical protein
MKTFEDKLQASAQRIAEQDNRKMHVPQNPLTQKKTYWGWVATPAAAVAGLVFGLSLHLFVTSEPDIRYVQQTDTLRMVRPVHDTLYLTQIVEKEKIIVREATDTDQTASAPEQEETDTSACTSIQCDGINYAILASN